MGEFTAHSLCKNEEMNLLPAKKAACKHVACVASVSSRGSSRKLGQEQKKMNDGAGGGEPFFCFRSNFRAITRLETLATQASKHALLISDLY